RLQRAAGHVRALAEEPRRPTHTPLQHNLRHPGHPVHAAGWITQAAEGLDGAREGIGSALNERPGAQKEDWHARLRDAFDREANREGYRDEGERTKRKEELIQRFRDRGSAGFREARLPSIALLPSTKLWC